MPIQHINLYPWRQEKHQKQMKIWLAFFIINLLVALISMGILLHSNQQKHQSIQIIQQAYQQDKKKLAYLQQELETMKHFFQQEKIFSVFSTKQIKLFLHLLNRLYIQGGELNLVAIENQQIHLQGMAMNQQAFDYIEKSLNKYPYVSQFKLENFHTQQSHIFFTFTFFLDEQKNATTFP